VWFRPPIRAPLRAWNVCWNVLLLIQNDHEKCLRNDQSYHEYWVSTPAISGRSIVGPTEADRIDWYQVSQGNFLVILMGKLFSLTLHFSHYHFASLQLHWIVHKRLCPNISCKTAMNTWHRGYLRSHLYEYLIHAPSLAAVHAWYSFGAPTKDVSCPLYSYIYLIWFEHSDLIAQPAHDEKHAWVSSRRSQWAISSVSVFMTYRSKLYMDWSWLPHELLRAHKY